MKDGGADLYSDLITLNSKLNSYKGDLAAYPKRLLSEEHKDYVQNTLCDYGIKDVIVVRTALELPLKCIIRFIKYGYELVDVNGAYDAEENEAYVISSSVTELDSLLRTGKHEYWGHKLCVDRYGTAFRKLCLKKFESTNIEDCAPLIKGYNLDVTLEEHQYVLIQEVIAENAEFADSESTFLGNVDLFLGVSPRHQ